MASAEAIPADGHENAVRVGWLTKQGGSGIRKNWKKRWFVLADGFLYYYKQSNDNEPVGVVNLAKYSSVFQETEKEIGKKNAFKIMHTSEAEREYHLTAEDRDEMEDWMLSLTKAIDTANNPNKEGGPDTPTSRAKKDWTRPPGAAKRETFDEDDVPDDVLSDDDGGSAARGPPPPVAKKKPQGGGSTPNGGARKPFGAVDVFGMGGPPPAVLRKPQPQPGPARGGGSAARGQPRPNPKPRGAAPAPRGRGGYGPNGGGGAPPPNRKPIASKSASSLVSALPPKPFARTPTDGVRLSEPNDVGVILQSQPVCFLTTTNSEGEQHITALSKFTPISDSGAFVCALLEDGFATETVMTTGRFVLNVAVQGMEKDLTAAADSPTGVPLESTSFTLCHPGWDDWEVDVEEEHEDYLIYAYGDPGIAECPGHLVCTIQSRMDDLADGVVLLACTVERAWVAKDYWSAGVFCPHTQTAGGLLACLGNGQMGVTRRN